LKKRIRYAQLHPDLILSSVAFKGLNAHAKMYYYNENAQQI